MLERHRGTLQLPRWVKFISDQRFQHKKPLQGVSRRCAGSGGSLLLPSSCTEPSAMGNDTNALICWWRSPAVQPLTRKSDLFLAQEGRSPLQEQSREGCFGRQDDGETHPCCGTWEGTAEQQCEPGILHPGWRWRGRSCAWGGWRNSSAVCAANSPSVQGWRGGERAQNCTAAEIYGSQCDAPGLRMGTAEA